VPHGTSLESLPAQVAVAICAEVGLPAEPNGVAYWSDGGYVAASGGETIVLGPGAHRQRPPEPQDHTAIGELDGAVRICEHVALSILC